MGRAEAAEPPEEVKLLREIRDSLNRVDPDPPERAAALTAPLAARARLLRSGIYWPSANTASPRSRLPDVLLAVRCGDEPRFVGRRCEMHAALELAWKNG
jgi:hypothetical protein